MTEYKTLLIPYRELSTIEPILKAYPLQVTKTSNLNELLDQPYLHYPLKTFSEASSEPLVVIRTSGITAVSKSIVYNHDFATSYIQQRQPDPSPGFESQVSLSQSNRLFVPLPFFHVTLFMCVSNICIASDKTTFFPALTKRSSEYQAHKCPLIKQSIYFSSRSYFQLSCSLHRLQASRSLVR